MNPEEEAAASGPPPSWDGADFAVMAAELDRQPRTSGNGLSEVGAEDFWAYMPSHSYLFVPSRQLWPAASVNARVGEIADGGHDKNGKETCISASKWLDQNRAVEQMTWAPGMPEIIDDRLTSEGGWVERPGLRCFNLYLPATMRPGNPGKAQPWLDLLAKVYPEGGRHILCWLAHRVQHPEEKINHALVLGGKMGYRQRYPLGACQARHRPVELARRIAARHVWIL
jgi:hypothetical protein